MAKTVTVNYLSPKLIERLEDYIETNVVKVGKERGAIKANVVLTIKTSQDANGVTNNDYRLTASFGDVDACDVGRVLDDGQMAFDVLEPEADIEAENSASLESEPIKAGKPKVPAAGFLDPTPSTNIAARKPPASPVPVGAAN